MSCFPPPSPWLVGLGPVFPPGKLNPPAPQPSPSSPSDPVGLKASQYVAAENAAVATQNWAAAASAVQRLIKLMAENPTRTDLDPGPVPAAQRLASYLQKGGELGPVNPNARNPALGESSSGVWLIALGTFALGALAGRFVRFRTSVGT